MKTNTSELLRDESIVFKKRICVFETSSPIESLEVFSVSMDNMSMASLTSINLTKTVELYNKLTDNADRFEPVKYGTVSAAIRSSGSYTKVFKSGGSLSITPSIMDLRNLLCTSIKSAF